MSNPVSILIHLQEHQTVVYQMIQQIQQKRELQRLQMAGGSQLPMASLLAGSSTPLLPAGTPGLLPTASAPPLLPAGALVAPSLGNSTSLMAAAAAAAAVAAAGGPPVLTAQTNPFLSLSGADSSGSGPKGGVSKGSGAVLSPFSGRGRGGTSAGTSSDEMHHQKEEGNGT